MKCGKLCDDKNLSTCVKSCATLEQPNMPQFNVGDGVLLLLACECAADFVRPRRISNGITRDDIQDLHRIHQQQSPCLVMDVPKCVQINIPLQVTIIRNIFRFFQVQYYRF